MSLSAVPNNNRIREIRVGDRGRGGGIVRLRSQEHDRTDDRGAGEDRVQEEGDAEEARTALRMVGVDGALDIGFGFLYHVHCEGSKVGRFSMMI